MIGLLDAKEAVLALMTISETDRSNMQFFIDAMDSAIKNRLYTKYNELQYEFHNVYIEKCSNRILVDLVEKYKQFFLGKEYCNIDSAEITDMFLKKNEKHQTILEMFSQNEPEKLRRFIEEIHW